MATTNGRALLDQIEDHIAKRKAAGDWKPEENVIILSEADNDQLEDHFLAVGNLPDYQALKRHEARGCLVMVVASGQVIKRKAMLELMKVQV